MKRDSSYTDKRWVKLLSEVVIGDLCAQFCAIIFSEENKCSICKKEVREYGELLVEGMNGWKRHNEESEK